MSDLTVELNADGVHSIGTPSRFTTDGSFAIDLANRGQPVHAHINVDDDLSKALSLPETNFFVDGESTERVHVRTADVEEPVTGKLKVVSGHGAATSYVTVTVEPPPPEETEPVVVDESLSKPPERNDEPGLAEELLGRAGRKIEQGVLLPVLFIAAAVLVALAIGIAVDSIVVLSGVAVVVGAAILAALLVLK